MSDKRSVRAAVLTARRVMSASARAAADRALVGAAVELVRGATLVAAYLPMSGEPGGAQLVDEVGSVVETLLLPILRPDRDLDWGRYEGTGSLRGSARAGQLREPSGPRLGLEAIAQADVVLVPALAVDRTGVRLGRGGGSYDRALARVPAGTPVVALLYDGEIRDTVPSRPHDRPVTAALTPSGLHPTPPP